MSRKGLALPSLCCLLGVSPLPSGCAKGPGPTTAPDPNQGASPSEHAHGGHAHHGHAHGGHAHHGHHAGGPNAAHDGHGHAHDHRFEDAEEWAKHFDDPSRDQWQRPQAVLDFIAPAPDAVVADLGAGTGYFAVHFARRVPRGKVLANDIEPDMVRYMGERATKEGLGNLVPVQGKPDDPALPEAVDIAFMCDVAHHIADRPAFFRKVASQLLEGGRVVIVDFEKDAPDDVPGPPPAMRIDADALATELRQAGLAVTRLDHDTLPYQYILELKIADR
ncbi:class I SAM-dependent methyltransferase [Paraliomyxa miuraensis]|uniref:class I SAM-dependent methyltransferase n=1 Tax=Paraliomyxa miuraensis TaxID=376150 RepID=UPI0022587B34|nr:class I SAM-dependent methyltransferase [Paraliomyxa miuraensis]MCX4246556.1 class I SAM-dependent methyltransferase [Paraliomyxa miuraensis]